MTISPISHVREVVLTKLQETPAVTALVPRLYPSKTPNNPVKPFGRYTGADTSTPSRPSGWSGGDVDASYHVFVGVTSAIPDPKTYCEQATATVADTIDSLPDCYVERTVMIEDGEESDVWHGVVQFRYSALAEL